MKDDFTWLPFFMNSVHKACECFSVNIFTEKSAGCRFKFLLLVLI